MKKTLISATVLFSETIWIYFFIGLFISVEWQEPLFVYALWWIVAGVIGYVVNVFIAGKVNYTVVIGLNVLIVIFLLVQNWQVSVPEGSVLTGIFLSSAVCYVYVRSASFVYKEAARMHVLQRFELTILIYLFLMFIFTVNDWVSDYFHIAFLGAIFSTLLAMILTLDHDKAATENEQIDVHKVGNPGRFIAVISLLFSTVVFISALFFLPVVREKLQQFTIFGFDKIVLAYGQVKKIVAFIFSLLPVPKTDGAAPDMEPQLQGEMSEMEEEVLFSLPISWIMIIAGVASVIIIVLIIVFGHFLKNWRPPKKTVHRPSKRSSIQIDWRGLQAKWIAFITRVKMIFRAKFARFYKQEVYWYFKKIEKWGKRRGISRHPSETSGDFVEKVIRILEEIDVHNDDKYELIDKLQAMNLDYEAVYYGKKERRGNYEGLLKDLKKLPRQRN